MLLKLFVLFYGMLIVQGTFIGSKENLSSLIYHLSEFHSTKLFSVILDTNGKINKYRQQADSSQFYYDLRSSFANTLFMISNKLDLVTLNTVVIYLTWNLHFECDTIEQLVESSTLGAVYIINPNSTSIPSEFTHHNIPFLSRLNFLIKNQSGNVTMVEAFHVSPKNQILHVQQFGNLDSTTGIWNFHRVLRNNLFGETLQFVQKVDSMPMTVEDLKIFVETFFETWNILAYTLNYTYKLELINLQPGQEDKMYPGTLFMVRDGKADISLDNYVPTSANVEKLGYLKPAVSIWTAIFTKKPEFRCSAWSFITVFTIDVWVSILATWLVLTVAYYIQILYQTVETPSPGECFLNVLGALTGKGLSRCSDHLSTRILLLTTLICGYLINNFFVFLLLGKLTYKTPSLPFETLEDLLELQPKYPLNVHISNSIVASSQSEYCKTAKDIRMSRPMNCQPFNCSRPFRTNLAVSRLFGKLYEAATSGPLFEIGRLLNRTPESVHSDAQTMIQKICNENVVLLESTSKFFSYENHVTLCKLIRSKKVYFPNFLYVATRKDFPYRESIDSIGSKIKEFGILSRVGLMLGRTKGIFEDEVPIITVIDVEMVLPIFIVYGHLIIISWLIFVIELWVYRRGLKY